MESATCRSGMAPCATRPAPHRRQQLPPIIENSLKNYHNQQLVGTDPFRPLFTGILTKNRTKPSFNPVFNLKTKSTLNKKKIKIKGGHTDSFLEFRNISFLKNKVFSQNRKMKLQKRGCSGPSLSISESLRLFVSPKLQAKPNQVISSKQRRAKPFCISKSNQPNQSESLRHLFEQKTLENPTEENRV